MSKTCIITGITGQDGAYLAELLLNNGYKVVGLIRSYNSSNFKGLNYLKIRQKIELIECDLLDITQIIKIFRDYNPDEVYNLAAQSSVSLSFQQPLGTFTFNTISVLNLLEAIRTLNINIKFYQASSSEMYGKVDQLPITINTRLQPISPYAVSKASSHMICNSYRENYNMFICCGILFNHESFLRTENFFLKKVIVDSIKIKNGIKDKLIVGNIDIKRDFGLASKYVEAMHLMMEKKTPSDYLICSGQSTSLRDIINYIFNKLDINLNRIEVSDNLYRPSEINDIYGLTTQTKDVLNWNYSITINQMLDLLIEEEIKNINY